MDVKTRIQELADKIKNGTSTPEEDLTLLQYINDASRLMVIIANEVRTDQIKKAIKQGASGV
jgi:hypothetical protein